MRMLLAACVVACLSPAVGAQEPTAAERRSGPTSSLGSISPTPEMWFYEQQRLEYRDPHAAVRRKAEFKATQRANRLAAMRLYGLSNSRPTASPTPLFGSYAPGWTSGNADPYRWVGPSQVYVVQRPGWRLY